MLTQRLIASTARFLRGRGVELARFPYPEHAHLRSVLSRVFQALQIDCVLDVGACIGQYGLQLREMGYAGWIVSFEPQSAMHPTLRRHAAADGRWRVFQYALGSMTGVRPINVMHGPGYSSFLQPNPAWSLDAAQNSVIEDIEAVAIKRLDQVFDECLVGISCQRLYLKMDTQGFDLEVLAGADGVLPQISALQTELSLHPVYLGMPDALTVLPCFLAKGFEIVDCVPVARKEHGLAAVEMDCIMVHKDALVHRSPADQP